MRYDRPYIRKVRAGFQWAVFCMVLFAGWRFAVFVRALEGGALPSVSRPPSVEGFMPIGALMALKLWVVEGAFDPVHPAALVIFLAAILLAVLLKKSFCSWICPVGTLSEAAWRAGQRVFGRNFRITRYLDYPLRSVKYLLAGFFLYVILIQMAPVDIGRFLGTPYWMVSDIKLLRFFTDMSLTAQVTLGALFGLSLFYKNFWCRYLCPYGGFLGLLSAASPVKIRRNAGACIDCGLCAKNCPSLLPVDTKAVVRSPECTGCLTCVSHCPAKGALDAGIPGGKAVRPEVYAAAVAAVFFGIVLIARIAGKWHSALPVEELLQLMPFIDRLSHP